MNEFEVAFNSFIAACANIYIYWPKIIMDFLKPDTRPRYPATHQEHDYD